MYIFSSYSPLKNISPYEIKANILGMFRNKGTQNINQYYCTFYIYVYEEKTLGLKNKKTLIKIVIDRKHGTVN